jgi:hypothetical protein
MRLLVSSSPWPLAWSLPRMAGELLDHGAELVFAGVEGKNPVPKAVRGRPGVSVVHLPAARDPDQEQAVKLLRALSALARFYDPELADADWSRVRAANRSLHFAGHPNQYERAPMLAALEVPPDVRGRVAEAVSAVESRVPPPDGLVEAIAALKVDAALIVSRCSLGAAERDLLKATRELDLRALMLVWSWDNLSSKAVLHEHPDHLLVWNAIQVDEAERLHGFPRERVHALGAPGFDDFFDAMAAVERPPRNGKTILYLGSSTNISTHEPDIFAAWLAAVRNAEDPAVRDAHVVVRPYPGSGAWKHWQPEPGQAGVAVSRGHRWKRDGLATTLAGVDAVVALNTSGELEAAIAGVPVVTFRAGPDAPGQEGSIHFEYLLERNGGFVVDSHDLDEHVDNLRRALHGEHDLVGQRAFVERFVRPLGIERAVSPILAARILELAA